MLSFIYREKDFVSFEPVDEEKVLLIITDIKKSIYDFNQIEIQYSIRSGTKTNFYVYDYIHIKPNQSTSWKMVEFMKATFENKDGVKNLEDFIGKFVVVDLKKTERNGKTYQNLIYCKDQTHYNKFLLGGFETHVREELLPF